jgi:hypothetical protein
MQHRVVFFGPRVALHFTGLYLIIAISMQWFRVSLAGWDASACGPNTRPQCAGAGRTFKTLNNKYLTLLSCIAQFYSLFLGKRPRVIAEFGFMSKNQDVSSFCLASRSTTRKSHNNLVHIA